MSFLKKLDPTSQNFMGLGPTAGRIISDMLTLPMGTTEWFRKDPMGFGSNTIAGKVGHGIGGSMEGGAGGAASGFMTGGPYGAIVGGGLGATTGGVRSGLGDSDPTSLHGHGGGALGNFGIGFGEGLVGGSAVSGMAGGGGGAAGTGGTGGTASSPVHNALNYMRMGQMGGGEQPAQPPQQNSMERIYQMYPALRPRMGGTYGA